jgi:hypothetical protein
MVGATDVGASADPGQSPRATMSMDYNIIKNRLIFHENRQNWPNSPKIDRFNLKIWEILK